MFFALLGSFCAAGLIAFSDETDDAENGKEEPAPFDQDEYSGRTLETFGDRYEMVKSRFFNAPRYGSKAPPFTLEDLQTGEKLRLRDLHQDRPVVLLFGSIGCDVMRDGFPEVLKAYESHRNEFQFVLIYIREAHSLDVEDAAHEARVPDPKSFLERRLAATTCRVQINVPFPILIDTLDDRTATRWAAWPVRVFVVDTEGIVVYSGRPGPWGFNPGGEFQPELSEELRPHADRFNQESLQEFLSEYKTD